MAATSCAPSIVDASKSAVSAKLRDPTSPIFDNVHVNATGGAVCGMVNGKNAFGAYAGSARFYAMVSDGKIAEVEIDPQDVGEGTKIFDMMWMTFCK